MVSFWPFKGSGDSTSSFEKTLTNLTSKITASNIKRDALQSHGRRYKALWTLYSSFIYTIYGMIILLVSGRRNWGPPEYTVVALGPAIIYIVRRSIATLYEYRVSSIQTYLDELNKQKEDAIEKFKAATKYNTTQQLLEKYGAGSPSSQKEVAQKDESGKRSISPSTPKHQMPNRTNFPVPPTANIVRPNLNSRGTASFEEPLGSSPGQLDQEQMILPETAELTAREANSIASRQVDRLGSSISEHSSINDTKWYDRLLDVLLGEDETRAASRIVLICSACRLVNGQAPPGIKTLDEVGKWRCSGCKALNGPESEAEAIIKVAKQSVGDRVTEFDVTNTRHSNERIEQ